MFQSISNDYQKYVKEFSVEEPFDFFVFRPLAYIIVKLTYFLPLNPNHFSLFGLLTALYAGYAMATGTAQGFVIGGAGIFLFSVLDCCDGMIARVKQNGSKYGQQIDMLVDAISNICFYGGLFLGLSKSMNVGLFPYTALVALIVILLHASIYNYYKKQYFFYLERNPDGRKREIEAYRRDLEKFNLEGGHYFEKTLLKLFLLFSSAQKKEDSSFAFDVNKYAKYNKPILPMWGIISGSSHLMILSLSLMAHKVMFYFYFAFIISNLWLILVGLVQSGVNSNIVVEN